MTTAPLRGGQAREDQLLSATLEVLREVGYNHLTVDLVVARARASKATVYRRWPSKSELIVAAFENATRDLPAERDTGSLRGDLLAALGDVLDEMDRFGDVIADLLGELGRSPELAGTIRDGYIASRRQTMMNAFSRAQERGEIPPEVDVETLWDLVPAVIFFRSLNMGSRVDAEEVRGLVDNIVLPLAFRSPPE
ncbi:TetR/AcrR family transcriptional regulator [Streptomyces armeniacus]|uniref:TetR/AcrR family transcriptional regulator n=1 Tax=Streptomyces armeniacus TaxID=83291 RepID=UPI001AD84F2B|nr:TetR/AcrR family transcriptional regulator [Streptomyces armeniacus]